MTEISDICQARGYDSVFMGFQEGQDLGRCFASADIFAFPSFSEVSYHPSCIDMIYAERQTFGQVILEAMASGLVSTTSCSTVGSAHVSHCGWA